MKGSSLHKGFRWLVFFSLLLCACVAGPVLAADSVPSASAGGVSSLPSSEELTAALGEAEADVEAHEAALAEELATPEAEREREASRAAYDGLSAAESQALLFESFGEQLSALNGDPGRILSVSAVGDVLGTYAARVTDESGEVALLNSSVPVQSTLGAEGKAPVDLSLEPEEGAFAPANPLTEVQLPAFAEDPIGLEGHIEVRLPSANDHAAEAAGAMNLFYPETDAATDTLVSPRAAGVEVFEQLRSPESPEQFRFDVGLPRGATLRSTPAGGAEVVSSSGDLLEEVLPPNAADAQGVNVPVTMAVEGDSLLLEVPHRTLELAYPLLVDPDFVNNTTSFGEWSPSQSTPGIEYPLTNLGSALRALSKGSYYNYPANTNGQWVYTARGQDAYIAAATFSPVSYLVNNCQTVQPHGYIGLYNTSSGSYDALGLYSGGNGSGTYETGWKGGTGTRVATIGMGTASSSVAIACAHELYVGGYSIQEKDPYAPFFNSITGIPSGWFDPQKAGSATITASDTGLGVREMTIWDGEVTSRHPLGCSGASGSRCPGQTTWTIAPPYSNGERTLRVTAEDPVEHGATWTTTTKVDNRFPDIELSGQFAEATEEEGIEGAENEADENKLGFPVYSLQITAIDGNESSTAAPYEKQSGVKNIEIYRDGFKQTVSWTSQGCAS